jgi:iodotyrosine deiodinase
MSRTHAQIALPHFLRVPAEEMAERAARFRDAMQRRRSVRHFSDRPVERRVIEDCLRAAAAAPSGANAQPWHFVAVSDPVVKNRIRVAAEEEERAFYAGRAPQEWLDALAPLGTDAHKPYLEIAPWLIAIFVQTRGRQEDGSASKHYHAMESVGIATGVLITGLHHAGLGTLTHTPAPMRFLNRILDRPETERPFMLLIAGYPSDDARVPDIHRKPFEHVATFL